MTMYEKALELTAMSLAATVELFMLALDESELDEQLRHEFQAVRDRHEKNEFDNRNIKEIRDSICRRKPERVEV